MPDSNEPNYRMNGQHYVLHWGDTPSGPPLLEVALAIDTDEGILHKHGTPEGVLAWARDAQAKLRAVGGLGGEMADSIKVITGRFPVGDLNRCITTSGYAGVLYKRLMQGHLQVEGHVDAAAANEQSPRRFGERGSACL